MTWSSSSDDIATVDASGLVTSHLLGPVTITATSTASPTMSGSVVLGIECPDPRLVTANLTADTTWQNWIEDPACFDYVVQAALSTDDETLTIEAGTVVGFEAGRGLRVRAGAGLLAEGTEEDPIVLTGYADGAVTDERGFWSGVALEATTFPEHVLTHTTIEYAGVGAGSKASGLVVIRDVSVRLENNTLRNNDGYGLFLAQGADVTGTGDNLMTLNELGPAYVYGSQVASLSPGGDMLTGNDVDEVRVSPDGIGSDAVSRGDRESAVADLCGTQSAGEGRRERTRGAGTEPTRARAAARDTAVATIAHADALQWGGRTRESIPVYREGIIALSEAFGPTHPDVLSARNNLALRLRDSGDAEGSEAAFRTLLEIELGLFGAGSSRVAIVKQNLAVALIAQNLLAEADTLLNESYEAFVSSMPEGHYLTAFPLLSRASIELRQERFADAERTAREATRILSAGLPNDHYATAVAVCRIGRALAGQGRVVAARDYLIRGADAIVAAPVTPPEYRAECLGAATDVLDPAAEGDRIDLYRRAM